MPIHPVNPVIPVNPVRPVHPIRRAARSRPLRAVLALVVGMALVLAACGEEGPNDGPADPADGASAPVPVRLVTHDSFNVSESVLERFTAETGYEVELVKGGDAVTVVNQAILTAGSPQGDVIFGIDDNLLSRVFEADLLEPYESPELERVDERYRLDPEHRVTPVDTGDVCVNVDREHYARQGVAPPATLDDLADPAYAGQLVVQNPQTSTPGLAFLLATVARYGPDGFVDYWTRLRDNGVEVVDGWETAYYGSFSGGSGEGTKPLVVSYASSPPAEVLGVEEATGETPAEAPTAVLTDTCYRQIEFAGLLRGASEPAGGRALIDFLLGTAFQEDVPLQMFVHPVVDDVALPEVFTRFSVVVDDPLSLPPEEVGANRDRWVDQWSAAVIG
jgi:thiamine transport system substrate-binding protein